MIGDYSLNPNVSQILWGTLFCLPGGFSFTALRLSTWTLAISTLCGLYLLLREMEVPRWHALLGAATCGLYPVFFVLGPTFMSDVPYVAGITWTSFATVRALRQQSTGWLVIATLAAVVTMGTRSISPVIPIAMGIVLVLHAGSWGQNGRWLLPIVPLLCFVGLLAWHHFHTMLSADVSDVDNSLLNRKEDFLEIFPSLPSLTISCFSFVAGAVGIAIAPLTFACLTRKAALRGLSIFAGMAAVFAAFLLVMSFLPQDDDEGAGPPPRTLSGRVGRVGKDFWRPFENDQTWALHELGATESQVPGFKEDEISRWIPWTGLVIGWLSFAIFLAHVVHRPSPAEAFLLWMCLGNFILTVVLSLDYDRYGLVFIPPAIALFLGAKPALRPVLAVPILLVLATICVVGVHDHLQYNRAVWQAVDELHHRKARDADIDGGYVVNGWLQFAHPDNAYRDETGEIVIPDFNGDKSGKDLVLRYKVANRPMERRRVLKKIPYQRWWGRSGEIFILEKK
jgi:hypothetical protein